MQAHGAFRSAPAIIGLVSLATVAVSAQPMPPAVRGCPSPQETARVAAVVDGRTLRLTDGREVRLAGLEVAATGDAGAPQESDLGSSPTTAAAARSFVEGLVKDREIALAAPADSPDRWGRVVAYVTVETNEIGGARRAVSLQREVLAGGHARLAGRIEEPECLRALREAEQAGRQAKLGLWSDPVYAVQPAEQSAEIMRRRGLFGVVGGRVVSVRESGGIIYLNFGRRWTEDFTATVPKRIERSLAAAGFAPKSLTGRRVEVRGVIEARGGPRIEILRPEQIAIADER